MKMKGNLGGGYNHNNNNPVSGGQTPPGKWFSSLRLCGGSGLGEKKTLNTSVVGKMNFDAVGGGTAGKDSVILRA